ncbi:hypothetical protein IG631_15997 [Alternaria alternata]|nr:hypothetical protein IG631_15997 [Alternaria alternata]
MPTTFLHHVVDSLLPLLPTPRKRALSSPAQSTRPHYSAVPPHVLPNVAAWYAAARTLFTPPSSSLPNVLLPICPCLPVCRPATGPALWKSLLGYVHIMSG